jgi:hypothetical protein
MRLRVILRGSFEPHEMVGRIQAQSELARETTRLLGVRDLTHLGPERVARGSRATLFEMDVATLRRSFGWWREDGISVGLDAPLRSHLSDPDAVVQPKTSDGTGPTGAGVGLAVLDSGGFQPHPELGSRLRCFDARVKEGADPFTSEPLEGPSYLHRHGVGIASIAAGEVDCSGPARDSEVFGYRVQFAWDAALALDHVMKTHSAVKVVLMAQYLAFGKVDGVPRGVEYATLDETLAALVESGRVFCAAAGNRGVSSTMAQPALSGSALTIGGWDESGDDTNGPDEDDFVHAGSMPGPSSTKRPIKPDLLGAWAAYDAAAFDAHGEPTVIPLGGTSGASARVAGVVATWFEDDPNLTLADLMTALPSICVRLRKSNGSYYPRREQGHGALDARLGPP